MGWLHAAATRTRLRAVSFSARTPSIFCLPKAKKLREGLLPSPFAGLGANYLIRRLDITCRWGWVVSGTRGPALNPAATLRQEIGRIGDFWPVRRMQVIGKGHSMLCQSMRGDYHCSGPDDHVNDNDNVLLSFCLLTQYLKGNVP